MTELNSKDKLLEKELSYKIQGVFFEVYNKYGNAYKESIYQKALEEELIKSKIPFISQKSISIYSLESGKKIGSYIPDFVIDDKVIVEIKAQSFIPRAFELQLISYLKVSKYEIGYIVNFGESKVEFRRRIYTNNRKNLRVMH
ncbi:MAG: GxxExxY protein [Minisyncoccia bacterium]